MLTAISISEKWNMNYLIQSLGNMFTWHTVLQIGVTILNQCEVILRVEVKGVTSEKQPADLHARH